MPRGWVGVETRVARPPRRRRRRPYWLGYVGLTFLLFATTATLVLIVLPERFVLHAGLRESGLIFPATPLAFGSPLRSPVVHPSPPEPTPEPEPVSEGAAEALWRELTPLLRQQRYQEALALMHEYLQLFPEDTGVQREEARTLILAGEAEGALEALERLVATTGALEDRLMLARFLRDHDRPEEAISLYRDLVTARAGDPELRYELAQALMWSGRYEEAEKVLRELIAAHPGEPLYRYELARVLYWSERLEEALAVLSEVPAEWSRQAEARVLEAELAALLATPEPEPLDESLLDRARRAGATGDMELAASLYRKALASSPYDRALWLEWIDFQQYQLEDLEGARASLAEYGQRFGLTTEERLRLAELSIWTDRNEEALALLLELVEDEPELAEAWSHLGDIYRWEGDSRAAAAAYRRALSHDPQNRRALAGLDDLRDRRVQAVAAREWGGYGPNLDLFADSDDFRHLAARADASLRGSLTALSVAGGYRWLEGNDPSGLAATDEGPFAQAELARWWQEATVRTAVRAGLQRLDAFGVEPTLGVSVEATDAAGFAVTGTYEHGPAYPLTSTLETAIQEIRADRVVLGAYRSLDERWGLGGTVDLAMLSQSGPNNLRWGGRVSLTRRFTRLFTGELGSGLLSFTDAAPDGAVRAVYWDPRVFWSNTLALGVYARPEEGWGYGGRIIGGAALIDERDAPGGEWVPQLGLEGGISYLGERQNLELNLFYRRGRERDYSSYGINLKFVARP